MKNNFFSSRNLLKVLILIAVLFIFSFLFFDARKQIHYLYNANWNLVIVALFFSFVSYIFFGLSFAKTAQALGIKNNFFTLLKIGIVSSVITNIVSMGGMAGYPTKILLLRRSGAEVEKATAVGIFHTNLGNLSLVLLLPLCVLFMILKNGIYDRGTTILATETLVVFILLIIINVAIFTKSCNQALISFIRKIVRKKTRAESLIKHISELTEVMQIIKKLAKTNPTELGVILACSMFDWLCSLMVLGVCFHMLRTDIGLAELMSGFTVGISVAILSFVPGGIGLQEASMVGIFKLFGVDLQIALLASILFRILYYAVPLGVAVYIYKFMIHFADKVGP